MKVFFDTNVYVAEALNDAHLRALDPYEGLRIVSMDECIQILTNEGLFE